MRLRWPLQPLRRPRRFPSAQRSPSGQPPLLPRPSNPFYTGREFRFARPRARLYLPSMSRPRSHQSLRAAGESRTQARRHLSDSPPFIYLATVSYARSRLIPLLLPLLPSALLCRSLSIESGVSDSRCFPEPQPRREFRVPKFRSASA